MSSQPTARNVGTLQSRSFMDILLWVKNSAYSGVVVLANEQTKKSVLLDGGKIVAVKSNLPNETLVQILLQSNKIQSKDLKAILEKVENKEAYQQGEELVRAGLIDTTALYQALQTQMELRLYEIFQWPDGKFGIVPDFPENAVKVPMDKSIPEIVFRGLIKKYAKDPSLPKYTGKDVAIKVGGESLTERDVRLLGRELAVYRSINGEASAEQVAKSQSMSLEEIYPILNALKDLGIVRFVAAVKENVKVKEPESKEQLIADIRKKYERGKKDNYFDVLALSKKATEKEVKAAYFELAKKYHPDRIALQLSGEDKKYAEDYFSLITQAHNTLSNVNLRKEYEASLVVEDTGITIQQAEKILQSEMLFQKGLLMLKKSNYAEVIALLQEAMSLYDEEAEYKLILGWAFFRDGTLKKNALHVKKGKDLVRQAMEKNPRLQGYYYLGMIEKSEGREDLALKHFEKALSQNPNNMDATNEIRVIAMKDSKKESKGILGGMFGKKK